MHRPWLPRSPYARALLRLVVLYGVIATAMTVAVRSSSPDVKATAFCVMIVAVLLSGWFGEWRSLGRFVTRAFGDARRETRTTPTSTPSNGPIAERERRAAMPLRKFARVGYAALPIAIVGAYLWFALGRHLV